MANWVTVERKFEEVAEGWGDGGWGDMAWGGSVGTVWQKVDDSAATWVKTDRAE